MSSVLLIHHISCGFFRTPFAALSYGQGGILARGPYVIHCLLIELDAEAGGGLALVDTGLSERDIENPLLRLGIGMTLGGGATRGMSALRHVQRLGFQAGDVKHILMTHLDKDHAGGLEDFPGAQVHVHPAELRAAMQRRRLIDRQRYSGLHFSHKPNWQVLDTQSARKWQEEFRAFTVPGLSEKILMVDLPGHSAGHCGVAIETIRGWLLHCGDAVYHGSWLQSAKRRPPLLIQGVEMLLQSDARARALTRAKLQRLTARGGAKVFASHDPVAFKELGGMV
ncbi:MBL fold metallo-hydrolase [bacterium]|nr:MBL fold metallo-hydrolase [bacterium]